MIYGLIEGRICHYIRPEDGKHLAAEIVDVVDKAKGIASLHVKSPTSAEVQFIPAVQGSPRDKNRPGTWHWVEKVD